MLKTQIHALDAGSASVVLKPNVMFLEMTEDISYTPVRPTVRSSEYSNKNYEA